MTAPTSPKPHTPADPNDLRTNLTKLADEPRTPGATTAGEVLMEIRALLAAHPAPETNAHVCTVHCDVDHYPAPVSETRREVVMAVADALEAEIGDLLPPGSYAWERFAEKALAALPAPPVVDEAEVDAVGALAAREMLTPGSTFLLPHERAMVHHVGRAVAAHMRGATRG